MCGRFTLSARPEAVAELLALPGAPDELPPRYNIAPTQLVAVVGDAGRGRKLAFLRWGLIPSWQPVTAGGTALLNARAESVAVKPSFREAFRERRCLIPADGFFEWATVDGRKQPYIFRLKSGAPFALAGLWEVWQGRAACAIITTTANDLVRPVHDRMPVILPREHHDFWLNPQERRVEALLPLLVPYPADEMTATAVSPRVNSTKHDDAACVAPAA